MEKLLVSGMAAFIAVFMVVVLMAMYFAFLAAAAAIAVTVWLLMAARRASREPVPPAEPDPSPLYLKRWTTMRRRDARIEQAQWQDLFDSSVR